ncbi:TolC family protein [Bacteriovorax sp. PP10]|uniref:TolC family protein n=1 Tax=Bacteriovorax antarcticus TaxID=3088717 RepID=A0ABU5VRT7_9BACT|nr:TolC family protein [Bacteriovorax sp. PP10]MEA9355762.1 TolC family protein [Bacteriovorax sp. PP10]
MKRILTLITLVVSMSTFSQETLDLKSVVEIAKKNNPSILLIQERLNQADAQKTLARSPLFPNLSWNLAGIYQKDAIYTGSPRFDGDPYNFYSSDVKLVQTIYQYGALDAVTEADYDKKIQLKQLEIAERNLTQNVIDSFYRFILNQQTLENLMKNQEIMQKALTTTNQRYNSGRGQMLDILQVKTQLALIQPQVDQAKNQFEIAGQQLANFMGQKEHSGFNIKGQLKALLLKDVQKYIDLKNYVLPEYDVNQLQLDQLGYTRSVTLGKEYPTVRLIGDYIYSNYKKPDLFSDYSNAWAIQLQLTIPLFSGLSSFSEKQILESQGSQLKISKRNLENDLSLKQVSSFKNLQSSEASLVSSTLAVKLAEESQAEATRIYRLSQIDFLQFLTVQQAALQAKTSLDLLKYQNIIAYSNYFVATGQPLSVLVNILTNDKVL